MFRFILLLLIIVPALEIGLFILSGQLIGVWWTIILILLTGIFGAWLAKKEGMSTIQLVQVQLNNREIPGEAILDGLCILIGGLLLLTPGFITDMVGFLLLIPLTRGIGKVLLRKQFTTWMRNGNFHFTIWK